MMSLNGRGAPYEQCLVHGFSGAVKHGAGVFEVLHGYWNEEKQDLDVLRLAEHLERLRYGLRVMRLKPLYEAAFLEHAPMAIMSVQPQASSAARGRRRCSCPVTMVTSTKARPPSAG